ncbi:hypothetical protein K502DRAFT_368949 [Neoconidiobolus thromboides FSU 785]|nr:hypothetical protein K502DRAFT_368949 [Neoconidiobolus thromboides FSU 785]
MYNMVLESLIKKFRKHKVYKGEAFAATFSTLIPYSNWCAEGDIVYEITEKRLTALNYFLIKRSCDGTVKSLKFKSKNYLNSKLTTENKEQLASLSESSLSQKLIKWGIKLHDKSNIEKLQYQSIKLETKDGKLFALSYLDNGIQQSYVINHNNLSKSWEIVGNNDDQETLKFELDSIQFRVCKLNFQTSQIKVPEPILLIVLGHIISYQNQIADHFAHSIVTISI